jgi:pSer/pThr/pTyr-binding forkhead associated (FHA) protein
MASRVRTTVNRRPIQQAQALHSGDVIRLGDVEIEFREVK